MPATQRKIDRKVLRILQSVLEETLGVNRQDCQLKSKLVDSHGLCEGDLTELIPNLERAFSVSIPADEFSFLDRKSTVEGLCMYIQEKQEKNGAAS